MRSAYAISAAVAALVAALLSVLFAATGGIEPGVAVDETERIVVEVDPEGVAWAAGIRPGQRVVELVRSDQPGGWSLEATDGEDSYRITVAAAEAGLRLTVPLGLFSTLLAVIALAAVRTRRRRAELLAALAVVLAATPYAIAAQPPTGTITVLGAGLAPALWIARWSGMRRRSAVVVVVATAGLGALWVVQDITGSLPDGLVEPSWAAVIVVATLAMLVRGADVTPARVLGAFAAIRVVDAAVVAIAGLVAIALSASGQTIVLVGAVPLLAILVYARSRRVIQQSIDRLFLAELRERTAFQAAEEERARMSREIHDAPLQAIAGVIQQLERDPEASAARESLRSVAAQLRSVATDLHPPVLDDLGLVPAIEAVARQASGTMTVDVSLDSNTGYTRDARPPADVELAVYRIVQEAVTNAVRHSGGCRVAITGRVSRAQIDLEIADDGVGISTDRVEAAMRAGHLGVASMRRRAAAIDARLEHLAEPGRGTRVRLRWTT